MPESTSTLTIVFRGLMVFHREPDHVEIGVLPAPGHFPRINTIKNSVLATTFDLQDPNHPIDPAHPVWRLDVDQPVVGVSLRASDDDFVRKTHQDETDLRWMSDLENKEFYDEDLTKLVNTNLLTPVVKIFNGDFYTRLKTPVLLRTKGNSAAEEFGSIAGVTGCDIQLEGVGARLIEDGSDREIFDFKNEPNTIYEFANTPPDIVPQGAHEHEHGGNGVPNDHFQLYYRLFFNQDSVEKFGFKQLDPGSLGPPAPSPALCGLIEFGKRTTPLR